MFLLRRLTRAISTLHRSFVPLVYVANRRSFRRSYLRDVTASRKGDWFVSLRWDVRAFDVLLFVWFSTLVILSFTCVLVLSVGWLNFGVLLFRVRSVLFFCCLLFLSTRKLYFSLFCLVVTSFSLGWYIYLPFPLFHLLFLSFFFLSFRLLPFSLPLFLLFSLSLFFVLPSYHSFHLLLISSSLFSLPPLSPSPFLLLLILLSPSFPLPFILFFLPLSLPPDTHAPDSWRLRITQTIRG